MTTTQVPLYLALHRLMDDLGFRVHDCTGPGKPLGGVCLHPNTPGGGYPEGIVVCWTPHDRLGRDADGPDPARDRLYHTLQDVMNDDLALLLETAGCTLQPFGQAGATLVTATPAGAGEREPAERRVDC
jgi:hypothetical protein